MKRLSSFEDVSVFLFDECTFCPHVNDENLFFLEKSDCLRAKTLMIFSNDIYCVCLPIKGELLSALVFLGDIELESTFLQDIKYNLSFLRMLLDLQSSVSQKLLL